IEGEDALAFVRTRHSVGFGGDLSRIELQQQFLGSLMRKLKSNDTSPPHRPEYIRSTAPLAVPFSRQYPCENPHVVPAVTPHYPQYTQ
ncbi:LCP family protein, partial [Streptomyces erythrochromogenes]|uniref:LCP family glycopolymer transferase n=1 Tax=Streptomyces erythrochromogenes TaxID=285574 RepID=UPI003681DF0A